MTTPTTIRTFPVFDNLGDALAGRLVPADLPVAELMTLEEVATFLRVHKRTVWRWTKDGTLPKPLCLTPALP